MARRKSSLTAADDVTWLKLPHLVARNPTAKHILIFMQLCGLHDPPHLDSLVEKGDVDSLRIVHRR